MEECKSECGEIKKSSSKLMEPHICEKVKGHRGQHQCCCGYTWNTKK